MDRGGGGLGYGLFVCAAGAEVEEDQGRTVAGGLGVGLVSLKCVCLLALLSLLLWCVD